MSNMGGYAIVDADDDDPKLGASSNNNLEFRTYLDTNPADGRSSAGPSRAAPPGGVEGTTHAGVDVPFSPFNLAFYQIYFDIDTSTILKRVGLSMIPRDSFIQDTCDGQIDLYGPFWTLTTLILTLYTTSTLTSSISSYLANPDAHTISNIPLLSTAASIVYFYGIALPSILWATTKWLGIGEWGPAEVIGVYGYAMAVFVPVSLLCLIPYEIVRWVLVGVAAGSSGYFLFRNIYPTLVQSDNPMVRTLIIAVLVLHAAMAFAMKILFFSYSVAGFKSGPDVLPNPLDQ